MRLLWLCRTCRPVRNRPFWELTRRAIADLLIVYANNEVAFNIQYSARLAQSVERETLMNFVISRLRVRPPHWAQFPMHSIYWNISSTFLPSSSFASIPSILVGTGLVGMSCFFAMAMCSLGPFAAHPVGRPPQRVATGWQRATAVSWLVLHKKEKSHPNHCPSAVIRRDSNELVTSLPGWKICRVLCRV